MIELILAASIGYESSINTEQTNCLAEAIYFEARNQSVPAQIYVAETVMNRVRSNRYPDTVCEVINQPYQFSFKLEPVGQLQKKLSNPSRLDTQARTIASQIALQAVSGGFEGLHTALHYYNPTKVNPKWAKKFDNSFDLDDHRWVY